MRVTSAKTSLMPSHSPRTKLRVGDARALIVDLPRLLALILVDSAHSRIMNVGSNPAPGTLFHIEGPALHDNML